MADSNESRPVAPVARSTRPVSEALLNEKVKAEKKPARDLLSPTSVHPHLFPLLLETIKGISMD